MFCAASWASDGDRDAFDIVQTSCQCQMRTDAAGILEACGVDTTIAIDAPVDATKNWVNGSSIMVTQNRVALFPSTYSFPSIPSSATTFVATTSPAVPSCFGCNSPTSRGDPLVTYLANGAPPVVELVLTVTNTLTFRTQYLRAWVEAIPWILGTKLELPET
ncbi:hypothetical protein C8Q76DRAFT_754647 [Earliella scabrosa]|nr:hypothetical protein C8Q76DRAFT_754647 [Earliella scabrosa]